MVPNRLVGGLIGRGGSGTKEAAAGLLYKSQSHTSDSQTCLRVCPRQAWHQTLFKCLSLSKLMASSSAPVHWLDLLMPGADDHRHEDWHPRNSRRPRQPVPQHRRPVGQHVGGDPDSTLEDLDDFLQIPTLTRSQFLVDGATGATYMRQIKFAP